MTKEKVQVPLPAQIVRLKYVVRRASVEQDPHKKRHALQKVIELMTTGVDVKDVMTEMVLCVETNDLVIKKLVYFYIVHNVRDDSELAMLCIKTLVQDSHHYDPQIRGLAIRSLSSLCVPNLMDHIHAPLSSALTDPSAYVRRAGVLGLLKTAKRSPFILEETDVIDTLYNMLNDRDPQVVSNCILTLNELLKNDGGMAINRPLLLHLLHRFEDFNEWGQCTIVQLLTKYKPQSKEEVMELQNLLEPGIRSPNSGVVLGTVKCLLAFSEEEEDIHAQTILRVRYPLLMLLTGSEEIQFVVLSHIHQIVQRTNSFNYDYAHFYNRHGEPTYIQYLKLRILFYLTTEENCKLILAEISNYLTDRNPEVVRRSVSLMIEISTKFKHVVKIVMSSLLDFWDYSGRVDGIEALPNLLRQYPEESVWILKLLPRILYVDADTKEDDTVAMLWMLGEFGKAIPKAPIVLKSFMREYPSLSPKIRQSLLSCTMKVFFQYPTKVQKTLGELLCRAIKEECPLDLRDRALFYYRLLKKNPYKAASIVHPLQEPQGLLPPVDCIVRPFQEYDTMVAVCPPSSSVRIVNELPRAVIYPLQKDVSTSMESSKEIKKENSPKRRKPSYIAVEAPDIEPDDFEDMWLEWPSSDVLEIEFNCFPDILPFEDCFWSRAIAIVASGVVEEEYKCFLYGHVAPVEFLAELRLQKSSLKGTLEIKVEHPTAEATPCEFLLKAAMAPYLVLPCSSCQS